MKTSLALVLVGALALGACGKKEEAASGDSGSAGSAGAAASATAAAQPKPTTPVATTPPKPVNNDADAAAVRGCCAALRKAADDEKDAVTKGKLSSAAGICDGHANSVKSGGMPRSSAISSIRAAAGGKSVPGACN